MRDDTTVPLKDLIKTRRLKIEGDQVSCTSYAPTSKRHNFDEELSKLHSQSTEPLCIILLTLSKFVCVCLSVFFLVLTDGFYLFIKR